MNALRIAVVALLALANVACATLSDRDYARAERIAVSLRSTVVDCEREDACARPSPLRALGVRAAEQATYDRAFDRSLSPDATAREAAESTATPPSDSQRDANESAEAEKRRDSAPANIAETAAESETANDTANDARGAGSIGAKSVAGPPHYALILDYGQDALLARLDLIRGAQRSIDIQTYIYDEDDAGRLVLDELLAAARRGVKVRVLVDQLAAMRRVDTLTALSATHVNFEMRLYNPVLGRARFSYPMYAFATICCFRRLNQRMHNKLMVVDDLVAITGGRNYQDDYYDWSPKFNFRDRDLLIAGPVVPQMTRNFEAYWVAPLSKPLTKLSDVARMLMREGAPPLLHPAPAQPRRIEAIGRDADDAELIRTRLVDAAISVRGVRFIADLPDKHHEIDENGGPPSEQMRDMIESARSRVLLQTPYLVLSEPAQRMFRRLQKRENPPRVVVSTNSLAATDAFIPYALSYKYKRRYLRDFKFEIYEFKPFPQDAPIDLEATGTVGLQWREDGSASVFGSGRGSGAGGSRSPDRPTPLAREYSALRYSKRGANERVPLLRGGVRFGLHAKSMVIDDRIGVIGTHNFDPRGENYNTEAALAIEDPAFAQLLAASIERDIAPANAWMIARRDKARYFSGLEYSLAKITEYLPLFDFWPMRYATSYEFVPGPECPAPMSPRDPEFRRCYEPVGDFPEVDPLKRPLTRIFTAFGAGLAPIL
ncbi:MAG: phospholipase D family protein [Xanthomonadaceae bacterium]|nr:phospholipase D family protein [Xanthomonadaceae bacterium]